MHKSQSVLQSVSTPGSLLATLLSVGGLTMALPATASEEVLEMLINPDLLVGEFREIRRKQRTPVDTEKLNLLPVARDDEDDDKWGNEQVPDIGQLSGIASFEFFDIASRRTFRYDVDRADLAKVSRRVAEAPDENKGERKPVTDEELELEKSFVKSWSNAMDNRVRRAIADGYSDTNSIYQSLANYGGCSATVLSATHTRMVAITAAHCVFTSRNQFSSSKLSPRRNGSASPTWGTWSAVAFGYYPQYMDLDCEDNWNGGRCIKHDIALVIAQPDTGASPPMGMGWGYRAKSFLDGHSKYRRGYPGCGHPHSPFGCTGDNLYGDSTLNVGEFSKLDGDDWNRQIRFSSDVNPGDSGSGLYYYRNNHPYVFAVTSAEQSCAQNCTSDRPNFARRITPQFYDFINSVVF